MGKMCTLKVLPIFCDIPSLHLSSPPSTGKSFFFGRICKIGFKTPVQGNSHYGAESKNKPEPEAHLMKSSELFCIKGQ